MDQVQFLAESFASVRAGSSYGSREAWYQIIEGRLVILHDGDHDNLAGNGLAIEFQGYTLDQARERIAALNDEPVGHAFDGCHGCTWSIGLTVEVPPEWLTYKTPDEVGRISAAIQAAL
jgi:hypothetical protein